MNYNYNKNINFDAANKAATQVLKSFFNPKNALISTPVFLVNQGGKQVTVQLSYYLASNALRQTDSFSNNTLKALTNALTQVYGSVLSDSLQSPISVQLELVRQHQPYMDASILAQYLAINLSKHGFSRMTNLLLNAVPYLNPDYAFNLSYITGIKVQLSGLLTSQRNRSRKTVYTTSVGTFHKGIVTLHTTAQGGNHNDTNIMSSNASPVGAVSNKELAIDYGTYTSKSGLGAFTVKVWIASSTL